MLSKTIEKLDVSKDT